ncbi:mitogen-activated protein kinase kinase kinase 7-like [Drosophila montana]|uniref:mitogen-activated protein kinase kinase kinase 7-like n=1 Tax=Drosophila montana TaxID=40370 RepID=UPI00313DB816
MFEAEKDMTAIQLNELVFGEKIGGGWYGLIRKGTYNGNVVAIKTIQGNIETKDIQREIKYWSMMEHKNIIPLFGAAIDKNEIHLVMEYAEGGTLGYFLHESDTPYTLAEGISWLRQAAEALACLHGQSEQSVVHRDVKPFNMLLDGTRSTLKICDFGFVRNVQSQMTNLKGTCLYIAPEIFNGKRYTEKCDVYSMGITIWEVLSRKVPYYEKDDLGNVQLLRLIDDDLRPSLNDLIFECPEQIKTLMLECWDRNPDKRPSMKSIVDILTSNE